MNTAVKTQPQMQSHRQPSWLTKLATFPALLALCIQLAALAMVALSAWAIYQTTLVLFDLYLVLPFVAMVAMQAIYAVSLAKWLDMAVWWRWIHAGFPVATWLMLRFELPNELYLVGFIVTLSMFWTTFRTQVPYYPSRFDIWQKVSTITQQYEAQYNNQVRVIDIGSGLGGFSMYLSRMHKSVLVEGIEVAPLPWLASRLTAIIKGSRATFKLGDYEKLDFANYDIIFAYLSPAAMPSLWEKAKAEMGDGCLLVSLEFEVPDMQATQRIAGGKQSPDLYVYQF